MPGVLLDEQNFELDSMPPSFYESLGSFSPAVSHSQAQQLMRHSSFSGIKDLSPGLSHSAPIYHRSQSAISAAAVQAFNYFSPPTTPKKSSDAGFCGLSMLDVGDDFSNIGDSEASLSRLSAASASAVAMAISGNSGAGGMRSLAFSNPAIVGSPTLPDSVSALHKYLPSNNEDDEAWGGSVVDVYACDQFRMFEFKVRRCMRGRSHDWTECPFAHPGEKARRRDPRRFHYSGTACPDFRKGSCRRGDACEFAHGVFECWLHPARYRTQPCKDGRNCRRRVCFFAHTPEQLRLLPAAANAAARTGGLSVSQASTLSGVGSLSGSYDGSPGRAGASYDGSYAFDGSASCLSHCSPTSHGGCQNGSVHAGACSYFDQSHGVGAVVHSGHCCASPHMSSPTSTLVGHSPSPPPLSPPSSPSGSPPMSPQSHLHWPTSPSVHQNMSAFSLNAQSSLSQAQAQVQAAYNHASLQASLSQAGYSQGPCSPLSRGSSSQSAVSSAVAAAAHAHSAQSMSPVAHRRHLDRLNSMPTLSIPPMDHGHRGMLQSVSSPLPSPSSCSPPSPGSVNSPSAMSDLIATIQQLGLRGSGVPLWIQAQTAAALSNQYSSGPSPLRRCSQSVPCTPTKLRWEGRPPTWEMEDNEEIEPAVQRVESGRDLRAKIYGRLGKDNRMDSGDVPDLGWVNELVKDEQVWGTSE